MHPAWCGSAKKDLADAHARAYLLAAERCGARRLVRRRVWHRTRPVDRGSTLPGADGAAGAARAGAASAGAASADATRLALALALAAASAALEVGTAAATAWPLGPSSASAGSRAPHGWAAVGRQGLGGEQQPGGWRPALGADSVESAPAGATSSCVPPVNDRLQRQQSRPSKCHREAKVDHLAGR